MDQIPTFSELFEIAPVTSIVLLVVGLGFAVGWKVRGEAVQILKKQIERLENWLDELRRK